MAWLWYHSAKAAHLMSCCCCPAGPIAGPAASPCCCCCCAIAVPDKVSCTEQQAVPVPELPFGPDGSDMGVGLQSREGGLRGADLCEGCCLGREFAP